MHHSRVTKLHDVYWHVNGTVLPTNQQLFCYTAIIIYDVCVCQFCNTEILLHIPFKCDNTQNMAAHTEAVFICLCVPHFLT